LNDKYKAALCYEKGNMYSQAIVIYQELNEYEKVGNLYMALNETTKAKAAYEKVVEKHLEEKSYVKAAVFLREKLNDKARAQTFLKTGWLNNHDAFNCLNNYFVNISDEKQLEEEIQRLYEEINPIQKNIFLNAIKLEYGKHESLKEPIETIAYEIIADLLQQDAFAASELRFFHKDDKNLLKDIIRYKRENK
jgi:predicted transcriptional regulator